MLELHDHKLVFSFPEVHEDARCTISFQRTLRIPDDNRPYDLPPGLGKFPLEHVEDHADRLPPIWRTRGGVMLPMYQAEALWISFSSPNDYPFAVKVAAGKINAVTGELWSQPLSAQPQDYVVLPRQPWLDGFSVAENAVRQFVAMPLGSGYSAEEQLTGQAEHGGIQLIVYPAKTEVYERILRARSMRVRASLGSALNGSMDRFCEPPAVLACMALAPGGLMRQEIYEDEHGLSAWDQSVSSRCFVHLLNSEQWRGATGREPPTRPPTAKDYSDAGVPWFNYYDEAAKPLPGSSTLAGLDSVAAKGVKKGEQPLPENEAVTPKRVALLRRLRGRVEDGKW